MNSPVSIEPMTLRGGSRPDESSAGVPIGPQPPPPAASMKPANSPSGESANQGSGLPEGRSRRFASPGRRKRNST